jgi:hypothetical protein
MQLYARHAKPLPLRSDQSKDGPDVFASASADKKTLAVFCVNTKDEPVPWSFQPDGFAGQLHIVSVEAVCDARDARQPDVVNHWEAPERIKTAPLPFSQNSVLLPALSATAIECAVE